jgi:hypothetical protein
MKSTGNISLGTLYEACKEMSKSDPLLSAPAIAGRQKKIEDWFNMKIDCYAMLLCHERRDYTIFHLYSNPPCNSNPPAIAAKELMICLTNRGGIVSIDETEDGAWEIWLRIDNEDYCYYLFRYDEAVIEC